LPIDMTEAQVVECKRILRGAGYSHVWVLDSLIQLSGYSSSPSRTRIGASRSMSDMRTLGLGCAYSVAADEGDEHRLDGGVPGNQGFHRRL
jgi:hypothetical protein